MHGLSNSYRGWYAAVTWRVWAACSVTTRVSQRVAGCVSRGSGRVYAGRHDHWRVA